MTLLLLLLQEDLCCNLSWISTGRGLDLSLLGKIDAAGSRFPEEPSEPEQTRILVLLRAVVQLSSRLIYCILFQKLTPQMFEELHRKRHLTPCGDAFVVHGQRKYCVSSDEKSCSVQRAAPGSRTHSLSMRALALCVTSPEEAAYVPKTLRDGRLLLAAAILF